MRLLLPFVLALLLIPDPARDFAELEAGLLEAETLEIPFHVTAKGAVTVDIRGQLNVRPDSTSLTGVGTFAGRPVDVFLHAGSETMTWGNADTTMTAPRAPHLNEALIVGLTRMGILHNLARLTGAAPPDHADGGVSDWVTLAGFRADSTGIGFDITVSNVPSGTATLTTDPSGHLTERHQRVDFPTGTMHVHERYTNPD